MIFSKKLQQLRKMNGLSQEQLAEKLNVSRQAISKWEMGSIPDMENIVKISRYFDCSLDYLMNNEIDNIQGKPSEPITMVLESESKKKSLLIVLGVISSGAGAIGLLVIGILASVFPVTLYDDPQADVKAVLQEGFGAFLKVYNITWLFALCCVLLAGGLCSILIKVYKEKRDRSL